MKETKLIEIEIQPNFKDFWRVIFWQSFKKFWFMYLLTLIISIPVICLSLYALITNPIVKLSPALIIPLLPLLVVLLNQWSVYSGAKSSVASVKGKSQWAFSKDGFEVFTPVVRNQSDWSNLERIEEKKEYFLLYPQKNISIPIPKRFFQSEAQVQEFRELVRHKLGNKAFLQTPKRTLGLK